MTHGFCPFFSFFFPPPPPSTTHSSLAFLARSSPTGSSNSSSRSRLSPEMLSSVSGVGREAEAAAGSAEVMGVGFELSLGALLDWASPSRQLELGHLSNYEYAQITFQSQSPFPGIAFTINDLCCHSSHFLQGTVHRRVAVLFQEDCPQGILFSSQTGSYDVSVQVMCCEGSVSVMFRGVAKMFHRQHTCAFCPSGRSGCKHSPHCFDEGGWVGGWCRICTLNTTTTAQQRSYLMYGSKWSCPPV